MEIICLESQLFYFFVYLNDKKAISLIDFMLLLFGDRIVAQEGDKIICKLLKLLCLDNKEVLKVLDYLVYFI